MATENPQKELSEDQVTQILMEAARLRRVRSSVASATGLFILMLIVYLFLDKAILVGAYQSAPVVADNLVQYSLQMLGGVGPTAKEQFMLLTETVLTGVREQGVPAFQKVVLDIYGGIDANQEQLKDEVFVRSVVTKMLDEWQREVQNVVDDKLTISLIHLDTQVKDLFSLSDKDLTKQQRAQKKLLLSSRVLIDRLSDRQ